MLVASGVAQASDDIMLPEAQVIMRRSCMCVLDLAPDYFCDRLRLQSEVRVVKVRAGPEISEVRHTIVVVIVVVVVVNCSAVGSSGV